MISPQNQSPTVIESLDGTLSEWYRSIDVALRDSEVIPGEYEYTIEVSYQGQCPVNSGGATNVDIKCDRFKCISFNNSYLEIEQEFTLKNIPDHRAATVPFNGAKRYYYVGYKSAFDIFDHYEIKSNGDQVQLQNHAYYESLLLNYAAISEYAKENSDTYATYKKIQRMDPHVPGTYIDVSLIDSVNTEIVVRLKFRIPLNMLLLFKNIKWYPGFFGKTTVEFYPTHNALVFCPVFPEGRAPQNRVSLNNAFGFNQLGTTVTNLTTYNAGAYTAPTAQTWQIKDSLSKLEVCRIRLAQYTILGNIYNALMAQYLEVPLYFPVQEVKTTRFNQTLSTSTTKDLTCSTTLNHCDSMFIVFNKNTKDRTCFLNPEFTKFQVNIDGKYYPRETYGTVDDVKFTNLSYDALNVNNNTLLSISDDVARSLQPYTNVQEYAAETADPTSEKIYWATDRSNFFIGIPFSNDEDFMGGINHPGTAQIQLSLTRGTGDDYPQAPTAIFLEDKILKIRAMKPPGSPQIQLTNASIEQIKAGAQ